MKYITQKTDYDCSPAALTNALIWADEIEGFRTNKNEVLDLMHHYCLTKETGTEWDDFEEALTKLELFTTIRTKKHAKPNTQALTEHLERSGPLILSHLEVWEPNNGEWHDSFWLWSKWGWYLGINVKAGKKFFLCRREYFDMIVSASDDTGKSVAYLLSKEENDEESKYLQSLKKAVRQIRRTIAKVTFLRR